jgi:DUF4097 and DUF4098 domain-containing protein YvlB
MGKKNSGEHIMKEGSYTMKLSAAIMLAMLLGSYLYSTSTSAADVPDISKVNGRIRVLAEKRMGDISSVNGDIDLDDGVEIERAETVNGDIRVSRDASVHGSLSTVNGGILLTDGSIVEGDIIVEGKRSWFGRFFSFAPKSSKITIDADSSVMGDIHLYRKVSIGIAEPAVAGGFVEHF